MTDQAEVTAQELHGSAIGITADIVAAYLSNNTVAPDSIPGLIASTHAAVLGLSAPQDQPVAEAPKEPAVPIKKSVTPDHIICLEDGMRFKSLKRHLRSKFNMSPDEYRAKWNLPSDYPMVAPNYSAARSQLAREMGLGQKAQQPSRTSGRRKAAKAVTAS